MRNEAQFLDFLFIGTPRSGSTWLASCLSEHPDIFIPHNKEVHFFNDRHFSPCEYKYPKGLDYYFEFFADAPSDAKLGELSPYYYYDPQVAARVAREFPETKIIAFLRNPADMLFSLYLLLRQRERRRETFELELERQPHWLDLACYHRLLTPWFDWFPPEQIWISCYESIFLDPAGEFERICRYLEVDPDFKPRDLERRLNASVGSKPNPIRQLRGDIIQVLNHPIGSPIRSILSNLGVNSKSYDALAGEDEDKPRLAVETRLQIMDLLEPELARLESFMGVSLDGWRVPGPRLSEQTLPKPNYYPLPEPQPHRIPMRQPQQVTTRKQVITNVPKKTIVPAIVDTRPAEVALIEKPVITAVNAWEKPISETTPKPIPVSCYSTRNQRVNSSTPQIAPTLANLYQQNKKAKQAVEA